MQRQIENRSLSRPVQRGLAAIIITSLAGMLSIGIFCAVSQSAEPVGPRTPSSISAE
ncbi:hypothetical protein [Lysinibacter cavernae]|uniref:Uncharacterized protein n=1 Tax=Lysinibacter cavernae TaxID=1640652 RepID=A0A7X5TT89_9MICO|nr:hypothetical protein [Lysinibacter cavernae]NIH53890.1 hypothetical protein [Lysinibacter cavernae]